MTNERFQHILHQLLLFEALQAKVVGASKVVLADGTEHENQQVIVGVDPQVLLGAFIDCRALLREIADAAAEDNGTVAPLTPPKPIGAAGEHERMPPDDDPHRIETELLVAAGASEPAAARALHDEVLRRRAAVLPKKVFDGGDRASVIECLTETISEQAVTIRELGSHVAELSRK